MHDMVGEFLGAIGDGGLGAAVGHCPRFPGHRWRGGVLLLEMAAIIPFNSIIS